MVQAACPDQHRVPKIPLQLAMVRYPPQRDFRQRQFIFLGNGRDLGEDAEVVFVPVPLAVVPALAFLRVETGSGFGGVIKGGVAACEETAAD